MKALAVHLLVLALLAGAASARTLPVDGYAAVVNQRVITFGDVLMLVQPVREKLETAFEGEQLEAELNKAFESQLEALVERALILEEFAEMEKDQKVQIPDRLVDDQITSLINERFDNNRAEFLQLLTEERMTLDEYREETRNRLIVMIMRQREVTDRVAVTPKEIREAYEAQRTRYEVPEQVQLRMIVLQKGATPEEESVKRNEAEETRARLLAGEDFADVAKTVSEGSRATQGGDMGWIETRSLRPEIAQAVSALEPGRISEVVEAGDELFILKIEARRSASIRPFDEVRGEIEKELRKARQEQLHKAWIARLRRKHHVEIYPSEQPE